MWKQGEKPCATRLIGREQSLLSDWNTGNDAPEQSHASHAISEGYFARDQHQLLVRYGLGALQRLSQLRPHGVTSL